MHQAVVAPSQGSKSTIRGVCVGRQMKSLARLWNKGTKCY